MMKNGLMPETGIRDRVIMEIRDLARLYGVEKAILFGSRAHGDFRPKSDIDLAFTGGDGPRFALDVDEETYTLLQFDIVNLDGPVSEELRESIAREGIVIYEKRSVFMDLEQVRDNLTARGFAARIFPDGRAVVDYLNGVVDGVSVGFGGSVTLQQIGLFEALSAHNDAHWHWTGGPEQRLEAMRTEVYVSSANGLAETGEIVNIDGAGNRIAGTLFGHQRVYLVIGRNKIAPTLEEAVWRARNVAAPRNAKRLGVATPCARDADRCYDCRSPQRICRALTVLWGPTSGAVTEVLLVREDLGL